MRPPNDRTEATLPDAEVDHRRRPGPKLPVRTIPAAQARAIQFAALKEITDPSGCNQNGLRVCRRGSQFPSVGADLALSSRLLMHVRSLTLDVLADQGREGALKLGAQLQQMQTELEYFQNG